MANCPGKKGERKCGSILHRCKACGNLGCDQTEEDKCTHQGFTRGRCRKCGKFGQKEPFK